MEILTPSTEIKDGKIARFFFRAALSLFFLGGGGGGGGGGDLLFYFVLSKIGGLEFLSIFLGKQITFILSPFYTTSFGVGTIYNTKETTTI